MLTPPCKDILKKQLKKYNHKAKKKVHTPLQPLPKQYGKAAQEIPKDNAKPLNNKNDEKIIQRVVGSSLFYGRAVDWLTLHALNTIKPYHNNFGTNKSFLELHGHLSGRHD